MPSYLHDGGVGGTPKLLLLGLTVASPAQPSLPRPPRLTALSSSSAVLATLATLAAKAVAVADSLALTGSTAQTLIALPVEQLAARATPYGQPRSPYVPAQLTFTVTTQRSAITVTLSQTQQGALVPVSVTPSVVTLFAGDSAPTLRFQVVEDGTNAPLDLTGAGADFIVRRLGQVANVFPSPLTACTILPNPATISSAVTGNGATAQTVTVSSTSGWTTTAPNNVIQAGIGTANQETVTVTALTSTTVTGLFVKSHSVGDTIALPAVATTNAVTGYCTYQFPSGGLKTAAQYTGQLRVVFASGAVAHSAPISITIGPSL